MKSVIVKQVVKLFVQQFQNVVDFGLARVQLKRIREMDERARQTDRQTISNRFSVDHYDVGSILTCPHGGSTQYWSQGSWLTQTV